MDSNLITCPHCGKKIELSEAIIHQLSSRVREEEGQKLKAEFEKNNAEEQAKKEKQLRREFEEESKSQEKTLKELSQRLEQEQKEREKIEAKFKEEVKKEAQGEIRLKLKEKDIQIDQIKNANEEIRRANEDLKRKLEQGSQQMQGEALELDLEERLAKTFPQDEFVPVPKGVQGADIWQKVKFQGTEVGSIVWETKRTKDWRPIWIGKLKEDSAKVNASEAIIVSQVLPEGVKSFDRKDGVWITGYETAVSIARYVRFLITTIATVRSSTSHTDEDWGKIRDYMLSDSFQHRIHTHLSAVKQLRDMLVTEQRTSTLRWTRQQKQIDKLDSNIVNFYGELKDIVHNLPELDEIDLPLLEEVNEEQETLI